MVGALALTTPALAQDQPAAEAQPAAAKANVAAVVESEFDTYDTDKSGDLNEQEFSTWLIALKTQAEGDKAKATDLQKWASAAFAQADADNSKAVSPAELTTFLQG
ncbi:EF-hand domain-containing protein [Sphingomonas flavalba]|uniref:EF-hand domain-containing protein n=1 Tax=Sphingomonas flavalba TaxID=2559804 RepID=UPI0039DFB824